MSHIYTRELEVAVSAARAAGELLLKEFHLPSGPRGKPGKADADVEAENLIRQQLLSAFPAYGYRGEETGAQAATRGQKHCWLVDPNDGTADFQKGRRGPAVSIGLIRDGVPVLGVVFSYAAPDDAGDLLCWAEGTGSLRRNNRSVERPPWPKELGPRDILLAATGANRRAIANARAAAPARFRGVASIAYRLALAAAGDATVAFSLFSPGAWDYCGAHALLRATGGEFVDQDGKPVTYTADGNSSTGYCFGGAPGIVQALSKRDWKSVLKSTADEELGYGQTMLEVGTHIEDAGLLSRAQGCLLGQLAGDALGSQVEFLSAQQIAKEHASGVRELIDGGIWDTIAGQPTDDSELALMLARSIVQAGKYDPEAAARAYSFWYHSKPFDMGQATSQALSAITRNDINAGSASAKARKAASADSQANGSLMRLSPLGIWGHAIPADKLAQLARADASLTHPNANTREAAAVFAVAIAYAISTGAPPDEVYKHTAGWMSTHVWEQTVRKAVTDAAKAPPADYKKSEGWFAIALQNAFYQLVHAPSLEEGVVGTVMQGGDTDTNAAIAGALFGAVYGRDALPDQWRHSILSCRPIERLPGIKHPRPRAFWPTDALELSERLLHIGKNST